LRISAPSITVKGDKNGRGAVAGAVATFPNPSKGEREELDKS
jgi:hypothetical protein